MLVIADARAIYLLDFVDSKGFKRKLDRLQLIAKSAITVSTSPVIESIKVELAAYFKGELTEFKTPLTLMGSDFQKQTWQSLKAIPFGETRSYTCQARSIGKPLACRAVANANGANPIAIVLPCHRVMRANGRLGGYGGGIARKKWLIDHEGLVCT